MGCHPSKIQKEELTNEIAFLRQREFDHKKQIKQLKQENNNLRGIDNLGTVSDSESEDEETNDLVTKLQEENALLKKENELLKKDKNKINHVNGLSQKPQPALETSSHSANLPKVGDNVLAMWSVSMWQYFTATIVKFDAKSLQFEINWDDQDPSGRIIDYFNLALDRVPDDDEVAVGSIVLFPQGQYKGQEGVRLGGQRWHQGKITSVTKTDNGEKTYSGVHTKEEADGKWVTFKGYGPEFQDLRIHDLRIAPNVLDLLSADTGSRAVVGGAQKPVSTCDVFLSFSKLNSLNALQGNEVTSPPSYEEAVAESFYDPREIKKQLTDTGLSVSEDTGDLMKTVEMIQNAKVIIAFLSDQYVQDEICRQEFQYAKKTANKPVIPVVVGNSFDWMMSVVGLLIAGELYIHFKDQNVKTLKMDELLKAVNKNVPSGDSITEVTTGIPKTIKPLANADVFMSYCWSNSTKALQSKQIPKISGNEFADARRIKEDLEAKHFTVWLDIERLQTTNQSDESMNMFQQIASGINQAKAIIVCISEEYAKSDNCRSEFQFALTSLKKPIVPVIVGSGHGWRETVIGLLVSSQSTQPIDMQTITTEDAYKNCLQNIEKSVSLHLGILEPKKTHMFSAPKLGDHVICHHQKWAYFYATIVKFDGETLEYTVDWDDKDPSGRTQSYKDVAVDAEPSADQVGVDSIVLFPQGSYGGTEGNNTGGCRFHQGVITNTYTDAYGVLLYDGHHTKGEIDSKWITYKNYQYEFKGLKLEQLRVSPNAMDALMACKQTFLLDD